MSDNADWKVESCPEWIGLMNEEGAAGEKLQIFADENDDDLNRRDTIVVGLSDKTQVRIPLLQYGLVHDSDNDNAEMLTDENDLIMTLLLALRIHYRQLHVRRFQPAGCECRHRGGHQGL